MVFTVLLVAVFLLNLAARKKMPLAYGELADYALLYTTPDQQYIKQIRQAGDSLVLEWNAVSGKSNFTVVPYREDGLAGKPVSYEGDVLRYKPEADQPKVMVYRGKQDSFLLDISTSSIDVYTGSDAPLSYELVSRDLTFEPGRVRPIQDWAASSWVEDRRVSMQQVQQVLSDSIGINDQDSTVSRIIKIAEFILARTRNKGKVPAPFMTHLHPLQQLREVQLGRSGLWCGNYTAMFSSLATAAGIPVRTVGTGGYKGGVGMGGHMLCEAYLREKHCWVYVDLLANALLVMNNGRYLNAIDIQRLLPLQLPDSAIVAYSYQNNAVVRVPFNQVREVADHYFTRNALFTFYYDRYFKMYPVAGWGKRIRNFFSTAPYYALYSDNIGRIVNYEFYWRLLSGGLLVLGGIVWIAWFIFRLLRMTRKRH